MNPKNLLYTREHEWISVEGDVGAVGITDHAQKELGDVVFIELPESGTLVEAGTPFGSIESVKAVSELFSPVSGTVTEANETLVTKPEAVNEDPYGQAWLVRIKLSNKKELEDLLTAEEYTTFIEEEAGA
ncbi:MAG: glycine cleavage system protein GcvH [Acidobacteria bacterium]|nr:glycine cleavage system protein GcvH [Acidobacteriota bacterium]MBI3658380.1 glycine cleavage system protein GcvH [Acidobacteriota bacterium]